MSAGQTIAVIDDDEAVRQGVASLLEASGYHCRTFRSGDQYLTDAPDAASAPSDCLLVDIRLPGRDGIEVLRTLRARGDRTPVVMMTGHGDVPLAVTALKAGAQDFVEKPFEGRALVHAISEAIDSHGDQAACRRRIGALTPRERQVMGGVIAGESNKTLARDLGLSIKTIELHRSRVMTKTGARSLSHLVRIALKGGLDPDRGDGAAAPFPSPPRGPGGR